MLGPILRQVLLAIALCASAAAQGQSPAGPSNAGAVVVIGPDVSLCTATVIDAAAQPIGQAYTTPSGNTVVVTLTNIPDNQRVTVQLAGINGFGTASVSLGLLVGDINGSQKVNGADFSAIKAKAAGMGTPVTAANYKLDLNQSGTIDNADLTMAKARAGWAVQ